MENGIHTAAIGAATFLIGVFTGRLFKVRMNDLHEYLRGYRKGVRDATERIYKVDIKI